MKINGEKIYLKPITKDDLAYFVEWTKDPEVNRHTSGRPFTLEEELNWFEKIQKNPNEEVFCVFIKQTNQIIGNCAIHFNDHTISRAEYKGKTFVGILIGNKMEWGKGYGTDALKALLQYAKEMHSQKEIYLTVDTLHKRAQRVYEKCGFEVIDKIKNPERINSNGESFVMRRGLT